MGIQLPLTGASQEPGSDLAEMFDNPYLGVDSCATQLAKPVVLNFEGAEHGFRALPAI